MVNNPNFNRIKKSLFISVFIFNSDMYNDTTNKIKSGFYVGYMHTNTLP